MEPVELGMSYVKATKRRVFQREIEKENVAMTVGVLNYTTANAFTAPVRVIDLAVCHTSNTW